MYMFDQGVAASSTVGEKYAAQQAERHQYAGHVHTNAWADVAEDGDSN